MEVKPANRLDDSFTRVLVLSLLTPMSEANQLQL